MSNHKSSLRRKKSQDKHIYYYQKNVFGKLRVECREQNKNIALGSTLSFTKKKKEKCFMIPVKL